MKFLFVSSLYAPNVVGGAERSVQAITESLVARGHQCLVVTLAPNKNESTGFVKGVEVVYIPLRNIYWPFGHSKAPGGIKRALWHAIDVHNPTMAAHVGRIIDRYGPELVSTHSLSGFSCAVWGEVKARRLPLNHTVHDYWLLCPRTTMFSDGANCEVPCAVCSVYSLAKLRDSKRVDSVIGISKFVLDRHLNRGWFSAAAYRRVIHNAGDARRQGGGPRQSAGLVIFGFLGRIVPSKGLHVLLAALKGLPEGTWRLLVGGDGEVPYLGDLKAQYKVYPVQFLGAVRPDEFFQKIDVLVVPSLWQEPLGRVVFEAYQNGIPVIAARSGGLPEMIEEGVTGFTYVPHNLYDLSVALGRFLEDRELILRMSKAVLRKAGDFTLERLSIDYEQHFKMVVAGV